MARLRNANPRNTSGGYERVFGNAELGLLASKIQSVVVSSGAELEKMIANEVPNIPDLDEFLAGRVMGEGVLLARKAEIKNSETLVREGSEPDFMVFRRRNGVQTCHVVELKDGHVFDTKKISAEWDAVAGFVQRNARCIQCQVQPHFCAFNQNDRDVIWNGFKQRVPRRAVMTGREFCDLLEIDYDRIVERRRDDCGDNVEYLLSALLDIEPVRQQIRELLD